MVGRIRIECFVDGFNLYHAIDRLKEPHLKWLDLRKLAQCFIDPSVHELKSTFYFSAVANWMPTQVARHRQYVESLKAFGVTPIMGEFKAKDKRCKVCRNVFSSHEEKETDVNIALWLLNRGYKDEFDEAFIVSRDSDLTPAISMVKNEFPSKSIKIISPPNAGHSKQIAKIVGNKKLASIKLIHLERSLLPATIVDPDSGLVVARRPDAYAPPS